MTLGQFQYVHKRLAAVGQTDPQGSSASLVLRRGGDLMVFDVWVPPEGFDAFGRVLMPMLAEVDVDPGEPAVMPIHLINNRPPS